MTDLIDPDLQGKLACPLTRSPLRLDAERHELVSDAAGLAFPVRNGVPVLIARKARRLEP
jgi:uncharacterized protein